MTQREKFEKSFQRPRNFFHLPFRAQWEIDRRLGILDWDASQSNLTPRDHNRFEEYYT